jgi:hypothetical protein
MTKMLLNDPADWSESTVASSPFERISPIFTAQ